MKKTIEIWVNGILTFPGSSDNWTGKAVTWCHINLGIPSEKVEYFSGALFSRSIGQKARARKLEKTIKRYIDAGCHIRIGGHSNGCDVILDCLKNMGWPRIEELHLISGACESDFNKNGLNENALSIGKLSVYVAGKDKAMKLADSFFGRLLGYGALGKVGPKNMSRVVNVIEKPSFGHSSWFSGENINDTMKLITTK